jgi:hypothetical protein
MSISNDDECTFKLPYVRESELTIKDYYFHRNKGNKIDINSVHTVKFSPYDKNENNILPRSVDSVDWSEWIKWVGAWIVAVFCGREVKIEKTESGLSVPMIEWEDIESVYLSSVKVDFRSMTQAVGHAQEMIHEWSLDDWYKVITGTVNGLTPYLLGGVVSEDDNYVITVRAGVVDGKLAYGAQSISGQEVIWPKDPTGIVFMQRYRDAIYVEGDVKYVPLCHDEEHAIIHVIPRDPDYTVVYGTPEWDGVWQTFFEQSIDGDFPSNDGRCYRIKSSGKREFITNQVGLSLLSALTRAFRMDVQGNEAFDFIPFLSPYRVAVECLPRDRPHAIMLLLYRCICMNGGLSQDLKKMEVVWYKMHKPKDRKSAFTITSMIINIITETEAGKVWSGDYGRKAYMAFPRLPPMDDNLYVRKTLTHLVREIHKTIISVS